MSSSSNNNIVRRRYSMNLKKKSAGINLLRPEKFVERISSVDTIHIYVCKCVVVDVVVCLYACSKLSHHMFFRHNERQYIKRYHALMCASNKCSYMCMKKRKKHSLRSYRRRRCCCCYCCLFFWSGTANERLYVRVSVYACVHLKMVWTTCVRINTAGTMCPILQCMFNIECDRSKHYQSTEHSFIAVLNNINQNRRKSKTENKARRRRIIITADWLTKQQPQKQKQNIDKKVIISFSVVQCTIFSRSLSLLLVHSSFGFRTRKELPINQSASTKIDWNLNKLLWGFRHHHHHYRRFIEFCVLVFI